MDFFDSDGSLLTSQNLPTGGDIELQFLGVLFDDPILSRFSITAGLGGNTARDDFIFGEPVPVAPIPLPAPVMMLASGLAMLMAFKRRRA